MSDNLDDKNADDDSDAFSNSNGLQGTSNSDDEERRSFEYTLGWNVGKK